MGGPSVTFRSIRIESVKEEISAPRLRSARFGGVEFGFLGGNPVLDFNNTIAWRRGRKSNERLRRPVDLISP